MLRDEHTFRFIAATVSDVRFNGMVRSATLNGADGALTVLAHHEPLVTTLRAGVVRLEDADGNEHTFEVHGGILEVAGNQATALL